MGKLASHVFSRLKCPKAVQGSKSVQVACHVLQLGKKPLTRDGKLCCNIWVEVNAVGTWSSPGMGLRH
ncbi:hypothetical protein RER_40220 [Rhodococcus erythropolis PR4]|uniref:Uncharacterized protein n=1 Tax=Rhodococcus erythropolis (strain PR4 / NBRC 100887) TaxID=234621 RepID=C1A295_RHOE4|nr:hypothetical protein RER_40220 [Rhodococcus erythropolis PR4]